MTYSGATSKGRQGGHPRIPHLSVLPGGSGGSVSRWHFQNCAPGLRAREAGSHELT